MANLVGVANGNFTANGPWGLVDHALIATSTSVTALTTGNLDSATFIPTANALVGFALRLARRDAGAATNTLTAILRNSTSATNIATVVINVSDLPVSVAGTDAAGGWHYFKFAASHTPNGTDSYVIRLTLSATTTPVSISTNGTANNWQRLLVRSTTAAPGAGDDLYMAQIFDGATNPATVVPLSITMDSTAATDYGTAVANHYQTALCVSKACTLAYGVAAATAYILRISGSFSVFSGGTFRIGSSGAEIPRDSTAVLEFDESADGAFRFFAANGSTLTFFGLSRTVAKNQWMCKLIADEAAGSTSLDVDTDTGWLNTDEIYLASTTRTDTQSEVIALGANAGAAALTVPAIANAHSGTGDYVAEIFLLTRNVEVRSVSSTFMGFLLCADTASVTGSWTRFRYFSSIGDPFEFETLTGAVSFSFCVFRNFDSGFVTNLSSTNYSFTQCIFHLIVGSQPNFNCNSAGSGTIAFTDIAFLSCTGGIVFEGLAFVTIGSWWAISTSGSTEPCIDWSGEAKLNTPTGPTLSGTWTFHSNAGGQTPACLRVDAGMFNVTLPTFNMWRNNRRPISISNNIPVNNVEITGNFFANGTLTGSDHPTCLEALGNNSIHNLRLNAVNASADATFAALHNIQFIDAQSVISELYIYNSKFSETTGTRLPVTTSDILVSTTEEAGDIELQGVAEWCSFGATSPVNFISAFGGSIKRASKYSYLLMPGYGQSASAHRVYTANGTFIRDTTTFDVAPASQNVKPLAGAAISVDSNGYRKNTGFTVAVNSGATVTPSVRVQIDASYNGSTPPELVVLKNRALGITADTVLDTHSGGTGSFETLSGATAAVAADGVLEFVVRCYGSAGNAWVDTWTTLAAGQDTTGDRYWNGQPITNANSGAAGGGATSVGYLG